MGVATITVLTALKKFCKSSVVKVKIVLFFLFLHLLSCNRALEELRVAYSTEDGTFSITSRYVGIRNIRTVVYLTQNGEEKEINLSSMQTKESIDYFEDPLGSGYQTLIEGTGDEGYKISLRINNYNKNFFTVLISVENTSASELIVKGFALTAGLSEGSEILGAERIRGFLSNGYQSWSPAVVSKLVDATGIDEAVFDNVENNEDTLFVDYRTSWWFSALYSPEQSIVAGAITSEKFKTRVLNYLSGGKLVWKVKSGKTHVNGLSAGDKIAVTPGEAVSSELIFIGVYTDVLNGLEEYAQAVALMNPPPQPSFIPVGWNSWNELFSNINETKILDNVRFIKENLPEHGFNNIQIDDGWERSWGDWEPNVNFPSGMDGVAQKINELGFIPGIWLAPFLISDSAPVFFQHNDWLLRDENGTLLKYDRYYILDTTNPDAMGWLLNEIRKIIGWGYRYLKLDFLFAGAYEAKRFEGGTSMMAYRKALKAILEEAKKAGAYILACGAPLIPTAGLAHGARIGADIAFSAIPYNFSFIKNEARNIANRFFLNRVFANDPDTALLRGVSLEEARVNLTSVLLSGKIFAIGDNMMQLSPEKISLLEKLKDFPIFSEIKNSEKYLYQMRPIDMFGDFSDPSSFVATILIYPESYYVPSIWAVKLRPNEGIVGLFNWDLKDKGIDIIIESLGLDSHITYRGIELWSNEQYPEIKGRLSVILPPRSIKLLHFYPK
jgi:hypothetical protein